MQTRLSLVVALLLSACGKNPGAYRTAVADAVPPADEVSAVLARADALWEERLDPDQLRAALDGYATVLAADPRNRHALERLARGWYFLGDSHLSDKDEKMAAWAKSIEYGKQCLALNQAFAARIRTEKEKDAVAAATRDDAPCLYWTASALGKWGKAQGVAKVLGLLPTVKVYITKVEEFDPRFFHDGPARFWGAYYSASSFTWDEGRSRAYFQTSIDGAPCYLATRVLRAEQLATAPEVRDFAMFASDLTYILEFDVSQAPDLRPENTLAQRKAQTLWEQRRELFPASVVDAWEKEHGE